MHTKNTSPGVWFLGRTLFILPTPRQLGVISSLVTTAHYFVCSQEDNRNIIIMNSFPPLFPSLNDEKRDANMLMKDFKNFLSVANKIQNENEPDRIKLCCEILHFLQQCANGKWCEELDHLLLHTTRCLLSMMSDNSTFCEIIYRQGAAKSIAALCSYFLTTRCRLRRSLSAGSLPKKCLLLLSSSLELLLVQGWI